MPGLLLLPVLAFSADTGRQAPADTPALHAVSSDRIRAIMKKLEHATANKEIDHPELGQMRVVYMDDLLEAVEELVTGAEMVEAMSPVPELTENERVTFRAMASQLYTEALYLRAQAENYNYEGADASYQRLMQTCVACHGLFREQ